MAKIVYLNSIPAMFKLIKEATINKWQIFAIHKPISGHFSRFNNLVSVLIDKVLDNFSNPYLLLIKI